MFLYTLILSLILPVFNSPTTTQVADKESWCVGSPGVLAVNQWF